MLKGKDLLNYALGQIKPNDRFHAIGLLASSVLNLDNRHKNLLGFVDPLSAFEYVKGEILKLDNCDELICKYLVDNDLSLLYRYGWKHLRIQDGKEKLIDEWEWFDTKQQCYTSMWKNVMIIAQDAIDMSSTEHPLMITSQDTDWVRFEMDGVVDLFTVYEIE